MPLQLGLLPRAPAATVSYRRRLVAVLYMNLQLLACSPCRSVKIILCTHAWPCLPALTGNLPEVWHTNGLCCAALQAHPDPVPWHWWAISPDPTHIKLPGSWPSCLVVPVLLNFLPIRAPERGYNQSWASSGCP